MKFAANGCELILILDEDKGSLFRVQFIIGHIQGFFEGLPDLCNFRYQENHYVLSFLSSARFSILWYSIVIDNVSSITSSITFVIVRLPINVSNINSRRTD